MGDYNIIGCDYSESYKEKYIKYIKEAYIKKCSESVKLSKGFRKYILDLDNINVDFNYDYYIYAKVRKVRAKVKYKYLDSYQVDVVKKQGILNVV